MLGFDHRDEVKELTIVEELCNKGIIEFKNSKYHTIARTLDGKLYCWGRNCRGVLGNGSDDGKLYEPEMNKYLFNEIIIEISCGISHSLVLTFDGKVYGWGRNKWGQIGNRKCDESQLTPYLVNEFNGNKVKSIYCGYWHSLALTESGRVYSWGSNYSGQLGRNTGKENHSNCLKLIELKEEIIIERISCGLSHSLLLSREGDIYGFGSNSDRELGINTESDKQLMPIKLNNSQKFTKIASHCDYCFSCVRSLNSIYYICGKVSENEIIREPKETKFKSFNEIFLHYFGITFYTSQSVEELNPFSLQNKKCEENFELIERISSGGFGTVFRIFHKESKQEFAIKKIALNDDEKEKVCKESRIVSIIRDSNFVVECFDFWIEENYYLNDKNFRKDDPILKGTLLLHIQMELCYKNLKEILIILNEELNLKTNQKMTSLCYFILSELFREILEAVNYLHEQNIIHRDLKPENILIARNPINGRFLKLVDFSFSLFLEFKSQAHTSSIGTTKYAAPEVLNGQNYNTKADIYSLGIIAQDLFDIDLQQEDLNNYSKEQLKIREIVKRMTEHSRPNCEEILKDISLWPFTPKQFVEQTKSINKINSIEESFHQFLIQTKLKFCSRSLCGRHNLQRINCRSETSKGVYCLQYDDQKIISGHRDNTIKIWDRSTHKWSKVLRGHTGSVLCLQYDERVVISGSCDATVRVWEVDSGLMVNTLIHSEVVLHLRFRNGKLVTCSKDCSIIVWDMTSPTDINLRRVLVGHSAAVNVVDFDEKYIVSASGDRTLKVWNTSNGEFKRNLKGHKRGIACLQYRDRLVISGSSDKTIRLWDIECGTCLRVLEGHEELVRCIRFNSKRIVSGSYDKKIKVWDLAAALDPQSPTGCLCLRTMVEHTGKVFSLQFDEFQIVSSSDDDTILIWDFSSPESQEINALHLLQDLTLM